MTGTHVLKDSLGPSSLQQAHSTGREAKGPGITELGWDPTLSHGVSDFLLVDVAKTLSGI